MYLKKSYVNYVGRVSYVIKLKKYGYVINMNMHAGTRRTLQTGKDQQTDPSSFLL
jgi:hypothetical protein